VFGIEVDWYRDAQVRNNILQQQDIATQTKRYARIAENAAKKMSTATSSGQPSSASYLVSTSVPVPKT
jgi:tagatose-1,6-bisphosphate aldolase non-catalytic subunit AgaZ/GatZ